MLTVGVIRGGGSLCSRGERGDILVLVSFIPVIS